MLSNFSPFSARQSRTRREALDLQAWCSTSILASSRFLPSTLARLAGEQHGNVDRDVHRCRVGVERRCSDMTGVRPHQHGVANAHAVEADAVHEPDGGRWPDPPLRCLDVASGLAGLLLQQAEAVDK